MKKSTLSMLLVLAPLAIQPACAPDDGEVDDAEATETTAMTESALLGGSKLLWPMQDGKATVEVCWLPVDLGGEIAPGGAYAADFAKVLPERKQWVREGVEREWNGKTVVQFVGWQDCGSATDADVQIQPIASQGATFCLQPGVGGWCVEKIGAPFKGKRVFINVLFGDEAIGEARYVQTVTKATLDDSKVLKNGVFIPAICSKEMGAYGTKFGNNQTITSADIAEMSRVHKDCLQNISNHEFGHVAGFSHEQQRKDTSAACRAQHQAFVIDDPSDEDSPLGSFETDSIMSYCRVTLPGTLTAQDVRETNAFYEKMAPKLPPTKTTPKSETPSGQTDAGATDDEAEEVDAAKPLPKKKKSAPLRQPSSGGCNG